ncbi:archaetidylserine decarboxylase [Accumulibacter sp.]|uniref:archaetidylserine decarboxylase n=1 Tax=Accumulibacter sp. TaxID=2053492 RepID=UPI001AC670CA|nr:archaetidylserine decarboxylase [Accumulibacter sp.]MBN8452400.1 phosphatidylserine decarboxylase [Accumulibacter sp.]MBO3707871.1 phosphatidylserine decarboxylase [Candidatus Accumulibacter conexus]
MRKTLRKVLLQEDLNFLLTNRVPRALLTRWMGWFSQLRSPWLARLSIGVWRLFTDLDLSDAREQRFDSLHACFTRALVEDARPADPDPTRLVSPSDGIVGACGQVEGSTAFQAKGFPYRLEELFGPTQDTTAFRDGVFITLRLTSSMYHRFHAPHDGTVEHVTYISGDTWNVNPIALKRVQRLFCRNERAVLRARLTPGRHEIALVPVAAILVASIRLHFVDVLLHLRWRGPNEMPCNAAIRKGDELGWFQHGSTILLFAPKGFELLPGIEPGARVMAGQALLRLPG